MTYVIASYGLFAGMLVAYVGILVPRMRARRRELAALLEEESRP
jgi:hypothetical protein